MLKTFRRCCCIIKYPDAVRVFTVCFMLLFQNTRVLFNIRVVGGSVFYSYLSPQDGQPLYHPAVDRSGCLESYKLAYIRA